MLEKVFGMQYVLKSPEIELFGHFKVIWHLLDKSSFSTAVEDENMASIIAPWKDSVTEFAIDQLEKRQVRDNYRELLELSIVFLGGTPPRGIRFRYSGAIHRARWMARAIYSLKMWLFRKQYEPLQLGSKRLRKSCGPSHHKQMKKHLSEVCLFVTGVYIKYWFISKGPKSRHLCESRERSCRTRSCLGSRIQCLFNTQRRAEAASHAGS